MMGLPPVWASPFVIQTSSIALQYLQGIINQTTNPKSQAWLGQKYVKPL